MPCKILITPLWPGLLVVLWLSSAIAAAAQPPSIFPYRVHQKTLDNGLEILVIETPEFANVVSYNTLVLAGARNELEPGKSGLAHLFEHILFRHRFGDREGGYDHAVDALGAHNNAWTWFDVTFYHPLTFTRNLASPPAGLPGLIELESSRFTNLAITEEIFKTEAGAVLGEYRRGASNPTMKMEEELTAMLFPHHPYGHTTMGFLEDVKDMPNEYQAAVKFYQSYYRPNNCVVLVVGDVKAAELMPQLEPFYRDWQPAEIEPVKPWGPEPRGEQRRHVAWDADVAPLLWVAQRMPAFAPGSVDGSVAQLLPELLVAPAAPLYKKLRYEMQMASDLALEEGRRGYESLDPRTIIISARLYQDKFRTQGQEYFGAVEREIVAGLESLQKFSGQRNAADLLEVVKSKYRYDLLASFQSPETIAAQFAWYYKFGRDPQVFERLIEGVNRLRPQDIDAFAQQYFIADGRAIVTMSFGTPAGSQP